MDSGFYRRRAQKRLIVVAVIIAAGIVLYWQFPSFFSLKKLIDIQGSVENFAVTQIQKQISTPSPLRAARSAVSSAPSSALTRSGIIANTNIQRSKNGGLPALSENAALDNIAKSRLRDMFQKQYFAHVAPDGGSAETLAKTAGYDYLSLGENLALGTFAGDKGVVDAWMASPGHRANILNSHYTEIGVAAGEGTFEGENAWIAVQVFGKPASACPSPDVNLKAAIDGAKNQLSQIQTEIYAEKVRLDAMEPHYGPAYNQKVDEYNGLANQYNTFLNQTKSQISVYNGEVAAFNRCIGS